MKSINRSLPIYLDYNATAPWSPSVSEWLGKGAVPFGNASSQHQFGKHSRRLIRETSDYLFDFFSLPQDYFDLFYHSGASEAINHVVKSFVINEAKKKFTPNVVYFNTDHACMVNQQSTLQFLGAKTHVLEVNEHGHPKQQDWIEFIAKLPGPIFVNLMWSHNETGIVWPVDQFANKIKSLAPHAFIHVDAVQAPGKIDCSLKQFVDTIDAVTFSGHKFGSLKGVGMTFLRHSWTLPSLIEGGGQQKGRRSGTENVTGVYSLQLALKDLGATNPDSLRLVRQARDLFEEQLKAKLGSKVEIVGQKVERNSNTTCLIYPGARSDVLMTALDLEGLAVSSGSACSSGATIPNRVLGHMGKSKEEALSSLRFSFPPNFDISKASDVAARAASVLGRY